MFTDWLISSVFWPILINIFFAAITSVGLVFCVAVGSGVQDWLDRQQHFEPSLIQLSLVIIGVIGTLLLFLSLATMGYVFVIPGILCGAAGMIFFRRNTQDRRNESLDASFSFGLVFVAWIFVQGVIAMKVTVVKTLDLSRHYWQWTPGIALLISLGTLVVMFKLFERRRNQRGVAWGKENARPRLQKAAE